MRIDSLAWNNRQTQGAQRREWLRQHAPQHLEHCATLILHALQQRASSTVRSTLILGAGACTEVPLAEITRASDEVVLADLDVMAMRQGLDELPTPSLRKRVRLLECDISGGVSANLAHLLQQQDWNKLVAQGAAAFFGAVASCLEVCPVPDPPEIPTLGKGDFGVVISSLALSQLFSYALLDVLDFVRRAAPTFLGEQERHRRYQEAAQGFRIRVINAHLHLLRELVDIGGLVVLLSDVRGFIFGKDDVEHRRALPLVPRVFPDLVRDIFTIVEEAQWKWLTDLPEQQRLGRGYEVTGYLLTADV